MADPDDPAPDPGHGGEPGMTDAHATPPAPAPAPDDLPPLPPPERLQHLLFDACRMGRTDVVAALARYGVDLEGTDEKGHTPLILASYNDHAETTAALLDHGARADTGDATRGNTALMGVAFKGYLPIARLLLARGARADARNREGQTALMLAALFGRAELVDLLIAQGADPDAVDAAGNSARSVAAAQNNAAMLARLAGEPA